MPYFELTLLLSQALTRRDAILAVEKTERKPKITQIPWRLYKK